MPAPKPPSEGDGIAVSWAEILGDWDTIIADLYATYGTSVDRVESWLDLRRLILGLMGRKTSQFAVGKALAHQKQNEGTVTRDEGR